MVRPELIRLAGGANPGPDLRPASGNDSLPTSGRLLRGRAPRNSRFGWLLAIALAAIATPTLANAETLGESDSNWVLGLSAFAAVRAIPVDSATVASQRGAFEAESNRVFGLVGISTDLVGPALGTHRVSPRPFLRIDVATFFDEEDRIVNDDAPGAIHVPVIDNNGDGTPDAPTPVATIQGLGSATGARTEIPSLGLAIGLDWPLTILDEVVHVKPSLEWRYERERITTIAGMAESIDGSPDDCPCRTALAIGRNSEPFHALGPGLELAIESGRLGFLESSVFVRAQALYQLDRRVQVSASAPFSDVSGILDVASRYTRSRWDYVAGVGIRLALKPRERRP